ncbi:MAG: hypothetical protein IKR92_06470 [Alphaproteobacteria bacterium]|nr:hypothetical protein [Alphaproteobacteria bacterium]
MAQKSLFGKFIGLFHQQKKRGGSTLSASEAINMQNSYIRSYATTDSPITPPYPEIIKQLGSPKTEIVQAALYYLRKIADNESAMTDGIITDMQKFLDAKNKVSAEHKALIRQTLQTIRQKHSLS